MKNGIVEKIGKKLSFAGFSRSLLILGVVSILVILSAAASYLFLENKELEGQLDLVTQQKSFLDIEVPDPIIKYAPLLVSSKDPEIKELAKSLGEPQEIYLFVRDNIAYSEDYTDNRIAKEVLNSRKGDCLGKADLLASLLLASGYSSDQVVVSMGYVTRNGERRHHAWVEVNSNGKWIVLDSSQFLGNFEFDNWETSSFYHTYQAQPYAQFNDKYVLVNMVNNETHH